MLGIRELGQLVMAAKVEQKEGEVHKDACKGYSSKDDKGMDTVGTWDSEVQA